MLFRSAGWFSLSILLYSLGANPPAESQTLLKNSAHTPTKPKKELRIIDGFRSAKFGMNEKQVRQAIAKDFKAYESTLKERVSFVKKNKVLVINNSNLLERGGEAEIRYILRHKSNKLIQVSIEWGGGVNDNFSPTEVLDVANALRDHFLKKRYEKLEALNRTLSASRMLVFRAHDEKGRTIILGLTSPKPKGEETKKDARKNISLVLYYELKPKISNTTDIKKGEF